jgi:hypothetical protein
VDLVIGLIIGLSMIAIASIVAFMYTRNKTTGKQVDREKGLTDRGKRKIANSRTNSNAKSGKKGRKPSKKCHTRQSNHDNDTVTNSSDLYETDSSESSDSSSIYSDDSDCIFDEPKDRNRKNVSFASSDSSSLDDESNDGRGIEIVRFTVPKYNQPKIANDILYHPGNNPDSENSNRLANIEQTSYRIPDNAYQPHSPNNQSPSEFSEEQLRQIAGLLNVQRKYQKEDFKQVYDEDVKIIHVEPDKTYSEGINRTDDHSYPNFNEWKAKQHNNVPQLNEPNENSQQIDVKDNIILQPNIVNDSKGNIELEPNTVVNDKKVSMVHNIYSNFNEWKAKRKANQSSKKNEQDPTDLHQI